MTPPPAAAPPSTARPGAASAGIRIRGLTVRIGGRTLLEAADADFPSAGVTLVVGASGAGKTVLLKILAGLLRPGDNGFEISGSIAIAGRQTLGPDGGAGRDDSAGGVGLVFQNFALFDELSCAENIQFAADHRPHAVVAGAGLDARSLLEEFRIPAQTPVRALSGGQQQRLALARTLAFDPPVIVYDEPTSGLDPVNAGRVARRIRETCDRHGKTTVVVTHDYAQLKAIADRVYVLDPERRRLFEASIDALADASQLARDLPGARAFDEGTTPTPAPFRARLGGFAAGFLAATGAVLERVPATLAALVPAWRSPRWGLRYFAHYLGLIASFSAWVYFAAAGTIAGFVATYFSYEFLPHRNYSEPLLGDEILNAVGFALYRIVVPVLVTVLLAARCGAAVASDVGNRSWGHQIDAMRSLGAPPARYLLTNILLAFLAGTPFLVAVGFVAARWTSLVVFVFHHSDEPSAASFWSRHFARDLFVPGEWLYRGTWWLLAKVLVCGLGVGAIAYYRAVRPQGSGVEVSRSITSTVIYATLFVLVVHFAFAFLEFPAPAA